MTTIPVGLIVAIVAVFIGVAVVVAAMARFVVERQTTERKRLRQLTKPSSVQERVREEKSLVVDDQADIERVRTFVPKSPREISRIRRRLMSHAMVTLL